MKIGKIYVHTNKITGMRYVGQTWEELSRRWGSKESTTYWAYKNSQYLFHALKKYGWDNFHSEWICSSTNQQDLDYLEGYFIEYFKCLAPAGYNIKAICNGRQVQTPEIREKIRKKAVGRKTYPKITYPVVEIDGIKYKQCGTCKKTKPLETEFGVAHRDNENQTPWQHWCKSCRNEYQRTNFKYQRVPEEQVVRSYKERGEKFKDIFGTPERKEFYKKLHSQPIERLDAKTGEVVAEYDAASDARKDGFTGPCISDAIKKGKIYKGFKWRKKAA